MTVQELDLLLCISRDSDQRRCHVRFRRGRHACGVRATLEDRGIHTGDPVLAGYGRLSVRIDVRHGQGGAHLTVAVQQIPVGIALREDGHLDIARETSKNFVRLRSQGIPLGLRQVPSFRMPGRDKIDNEP